MTRAAEQLNLAQSTVSKRLKDLESELGTTLIERGQGAKSIRLSAAGEEFLDIAQRLTMLWTKAQELQNENSLLSLTIGSLNSLHYALFPRLYQALSHHQPRIRLSLITSHSGEVYNLVENRQVDVGFSLIERSAPTVMVDKIYSEPMVVLRLSSRQYPSSKVFHPSELDPNHEIFYSCGISYQIWHDQWWPTVNNNCILLDCAQMIPLFLQSEDQWIVIPLSVAKTVQSINGGNIFALAGNPPERMIYKITPKYPKSNTIRSLEILNHYLNLYITETSLTDRALHYRREN